MNAGIEAQPTPQPLRGPFTRWPRAADGVLALFVFIGAIINVTTQDPEDSQSVTIDVIDDLSIGAYLLLAVGAATIYWRRRYPLPVLAAAVGASVLYAAFGYEGDPVLAILVSLYSVGRYESDDRRSLVALAMALALVALGEVIDGEPLGTIACAVFFTFLPWYVGRRVRIRGQYLLVLQERAEQLEREQEAEAARAVSDERARIARELHDVVAHQVSMMTVQAGAAKTVAADDPNGAREAMGAVEQAGRQALGELRHLLDVLRPDTETEPLGPQPSLRELPHLVERLAGAGVAVTLDTGTVLTAELPARVDLSAYRIVQEALTNVLKHGGPGAEAEVRLQRHNGDLHIEVLDSGRGGTILPGSGHGIVGMRERALLLGGSLEAGSRPGGGFRVEARLPIGEGPA